MGFSYNSTVGYGILIDEDKLSEEDFLGKFDNFMEDGDFAEWWDKREFDGLDWDYIWSEPSGWIMIYAKGTYDSSCPRNDCGDVVELDEPNAKQLENLEWWADVLDEQIKWYHVNSAH